MQQRKEHSCTAVSRDVKKTEKKRGAVVLYSKRKWGEDVLRQKSEEEAWSSSGSDHVIVMEKDTHVWRCHAEQAKVCVRKWSGWMDGSNTVARQLRVLVWKCDWTLHIALMRVEWECVFFMPGQSKMWHVAPMGLLHTFSWHQVSSNTRGCCPCLLPSLRFLWCYRLMLPKYY